ncbi:MAG: phenylacetate-CoA oxygenase subunit PaaC [Halieaceae bacterium]|nr:phenylacetate-CoA oxygenase subunit PaaC [Halieaceae bacterium]
MGTEISVKEYVVRLGDDALILGHRLSEWCRNAPFLEEDLALSNVALDFIGRASMFYTYAAELSGQDVTEDTFAYQRDCRDFKNHLIHELPRGDFAFTMVRQYFVDVYSLAFMTSLLESSDSRLAAIAGKAIKESEYHHRRSEEWMMRLGESTQESHRRLQSAVDELWRFTGELFDQDSPERELVANGVAVDTRALEADWNQAITATMSKISIEIPKDELQVTGGREGKHTEFLGFLLSELQFLQRTYPGLEW